MAVVEKELGITVNTGITVLGKVNYDFNSGFLLIKNPTFLGYSKDNIIGSLRSNIRGNKVGKVCFGVLAVGCGIWPIVGIYN